MFLLIRANFPALRAYYGHHYRCVHRMEESCTPGEGFYFLGTTMERKKNRRDGLQNTSPALDTGTAHLYE